MIHMIRMIGCSEPYRVPQEYRCEDVRNHPVLNRDASRDERLAYAVALVTQCGYTGSAAARMAELPRSTVQSAVLRERQLL